MSDAAAPPAAAAAEPQDNRLAAQGAKKELKKLLSKCSSDKQSVEVLSQEFVARTSRLTTAEGRVSSLSTELHELQAAQAKMRGELSAALKRNELLKELCDKLQQQRVTVEEHYEKLCSEQNEKQKGMMQRFQTSLDEIQEKLKADAESRSTLEKESQVSAAMIRQKDAELALLRAQLKEQQLKGEQTLLQVNEVIQMAQQERANSVQKDRDLHEANQQLKVYSEKFASLQSAMQESQKAMSGVRTEMKKNSSVIAKLSKDKHEAEVRATKTDAAFVQTHAELAAERKKTQTLTSLCKTLQEELKLARGAAAAPSTEHPLPPAPDAASDAAAPTPS